MKDLLGKEKFCNILKDTQRVWDYQDSLNSLYKEQNVDGYLYEPSCIDQVTDLLAFIFEDEGRWIDYWAYELNFGRKYQECSVTRMDGSVIPLRTSEDLYTLLEENIRDKECA